MATTAVQLIIFPQPVDRIGRAINLGDRAKRYFPGRNEDSITEYTIARLSFCHPPTVPVLILLRPVSGKGFDQTVTPNELHITRSRKPTLLELREGDVVELTGNHPWEGHTGKVGGVHQWSGRARVRVMIPSRTGGPDIPATIEDETEFRLIRWAEEDPAP